MALTIDKELLKETVKESIKDLLLEDPNFLKTLLIELKSDSDKRKGEIDQIIDGHFEEYGEVFRALA